MSNNLEDAAEANGHAPKLDGSLVLHRTREYLSEELTAIWSDVMLILNCFVTGLLDSAVFNTWSCFVSMQTGNTIYAALGLSSQPPSSPYRWAKSLTAILSFLLGCYVYSRLMRSSGHPLKRSTVMGLTLSQALLTYTSALLGTFGVVPPNAGDLLPDNCIVILPLALLSFQSGGQIVLSRMLGYGEITTVVLTSAYCDLVMDERVFTAPVGGDWKRERRVGSVVMMFAGAAVGGFLTRGGDIDVSLWIAGTVKMVFVVGWGVWKGEGKGRVRLE